MAAPRGRPSEGALVDDGVDLGRLPETLGFLLRIAQIREYEVFFGKFGDIGLKPGEFSVLWVIHLNPGIRQGVVARRLSIKRAHMTKLVRNLHARGVVERTVPDDDRRGLALTLTPAGAKLVKVNASAFFDPAPEATGKLSRSEQAELISLLRKHIGLETEEDQ
ncbi:MarR family transcriptional regulator [Aquamicrobium sp. LC103]|uniref:MarR family winged helix-turn-helix transcriptional regulator n=1 Tax=Aquamicrobium sp. LC103 TaxID=1120658 RepID=UPI00063E6E98|nr:MarR family transcriptional regulator [Aquamicrobium sp. LC103]TKT76736.1 MarR family transcriptional regulator [Aquamicrobium sp. LC103]